jgi:Tol biopolymer transport system component
MKNKITSSPAALLGLCLGMLASEQAIAATNERRPVCSPDGSRFVYMLQTERTDDDWELYLMEFSTQGKNRLTKRKGLDGYAVWSPDGRNIIFEREDAADGQKQPWMMSLEDYTSKPLGSFEGWLSINDWADRDRLLGFQELEGQRDLVLLDLDGNIVEKLTDTSDHSEHDAHFSPDGTRIAFASGLIDGSETSLELIELESGSRTTVRTSIGRIYGISWSPDGQYIAFVDTPGGDEDDADIFLYNLPEQSFQQLTDDPAWDHMPEFCNNNHTLFFTSNRSGEERIYQLDPFSGTFLSIERAKK